MEEEKSKPTIRTKAGKKMNSVLRSRKWNLLILTFIIIVVALIFLYLYLTSWRYQIKTDDAYVQGRSAYVTAPITGTVDQIFVDTTDVVKKDQLLISFEQQDSILKYEQALNTLRNEVKNFKNLNRSLSQATLEVQLKKAALERLNQDYQRRVGLLHSRAISAEEVEHARLALIQGKQDLAIAKEAQTVAKNEVKQGNNSIGDQPTIKIAINAVKEAWLNLQRTRLRAPIAGQVAKRTVEVGQNVTQGQNLLVILSPEKMWVEANFKETQLRQIYPGQRADIVSDLYGSKIVYHGIVEGVSPGTGAAFSLLPAQNATGNWIKVVQRVPVRIRLDAQEVAAHPLRVGLSMKVTVYIKGEKENSLSLLSTPTEKADFEGHKVDYSPVEKEIQAVLDKDF